VAFLLTVAVSLASAPVAADPSPGCGRPAPARAPASFLVDGVERQAMVVVPDSYHADLPLPLVMAFHGRTNDHARLRRYLGLEEATTVPVIFVYPAARRAGDGDFTWAAPGGSSPDFALFDGILAETGWSYCIDLSAVFVVGHSLGASFANDLACARPAEVGGLASVAGGIGSERCEGRVPALLLHNPRDELVPLAEGARARDALLGRPMPEARPIAETLQEFACLRAGSSQSPLLWCLYRQDMTPAGRHYPHQWPEGASRLVMSFFAALATPDAAHGFPAPHALRGPAKRQEGSAGRRQAEADHLD
jgi:polyhydroxybutyrate depolymerase